MYESGVEQDASQATVLAGTGSVGTPLSNLMLAEAIEPGSAPGYELCKLIYSYHPLGAILSDAPITRAQTKPRELACSVLGEKRILEQYQSTWDEISKVGATVVLHNLCKTSRIYGIATLIVGERGKDPSEPLDPDNIAEADLYFNVLDPLNTAGSLVLDQDPNSPDFLKPTGIIVNGKKYHRSRCFVKMHEQPIYIEYTSSAFGFVGRSVYQRALYPLKTYLQTMITDQMVTQKAGLLIAKIKNPGSFVDNLMQAMFGLKRGKLKAGGTGQVLSIELEEEIQTLDMVNADKAMTTPRTNVIENIAAAVAMPASIISNEAFNKGMAEGSEDAKKEAAYLDYVRQDMATAYAFVDRIVMRKAWTPEFYETLGAYYPEYKTKPFETALREWMHAFKATWPNLIVEPDSEKSKTQKVQMEAVVAVLEELSPIMDPENMCNVIEWVCANANERTELFAGKLEIDRETLLDHLKSKDEREAAAVLEPGAGEESKPRAFSAAS